MSQLSISHSIRSTPAQRHPPKPGEVEELFMSRKRTLGQRRYRAVTLSFVIVLGLVLLGCGGPGGDPPKSTTTGPSIASVNPNSGSLNGGTVVTIQGTGFQSGATVVIGGVNASAVTFVSGSQMTATTPAHAPGAADVQVKNPARGGSATLTSSFTYTGIVLNSISPTAGPTIGGTTVTLNGAGFQSGTTIRFGGVAATTKTFVSSSQMTAVTPAHAAGAVTVEVQNPDNALASLTNVFTYQAVNITGVSPNVGPASGGTTIVITGQNFQTGAAVFVGGMAATSVTFVNSTQLNAVTPARGTSGTVDVQVTNPNGAAGTLAAGFTFQSPVSVTSINPNTGPAGGGTSVTLTGNNFQPGAAVTFGGLPGTSVVVANASSLSALTPSHSAGLVDVNVANTDGQSAGLVAAFNFADTGKSFDTNPQFASISPVFGPPQGFTQTTITGGNYQSGITVKFGGTQSSGVTLISGSQIQTPSPAHTSGVVDLLLTNPDGASSTALLAYTYSGISVSSVVPTIASNLGGTVVRILGTEFNAGATAKFDGVPALTNTVISSTELESMVPSGTLGPADVQVTNLNGTSATLTGGVSYVVPPNVSKISPATGLISGGTVVTILGTDFANGITVKFGTTNAASVTFVSGTELRVVTPAHALGTVNVVVTNPDLSSKTVTNGFRFGQILFQDGFESGNFSAWNFGTERVGCPAIAPGFTDFSINSNAAFVHSGQFSFQSRYYIDGTCGITTDQDLYTKLLLSGNGPQHIFVRGYVYIKTPESGGGKDMQRKIFYLFARDPATGNRDWSVILSTFFSTTAGNLTFQTVVQNQGVGGSGISIWTPSTVALQFDRWYCIEMEIKNNTIGLSDGEIRFYIDGVQKLEALNQNIRLSSPLGLNLIFVGQQVNRYNGTFAHELRFWDDIKIADAYVGP